MTALDMREAYEAAAYQNRLTQEQRDKLERCEAVIERGKQAFLSVGNALADIREQRLYRQGYASFEVYLRERWGIGKSHAGRLIAASALVNELSPVGVVVETERQARALGEMDDATRQAAIAAAKEQHGEQVSAREVIAAADAARPEPNFGGTNGPAVGEIIEVVRAGSMLRLVASVDGGRFFAYRGSDYVGIIEPHPSTNSLLVNVCLLQGEGFYAAGSVSTYAQARYRIAEELLAKQPKTESAGVTAPPSPALNKFMNDAPASAGEDHATTEQAGVREGNEVHSTGAQEAAGGTTGGTATVSSVEAAPVSESPVGGVSAPAVTGQPGTYPVDETGMAALRRTQCAGMLAQGRMKSPVLLDGQLWLTVTVERNLDTQRDMAFCLLVVEKDERHTNAVPVEQWRAQIESGARDEDEYTSLLAYAENGRTYVLLGARRLYVYQGGAAPDMSPPRPEEASAGQGAQAEAVVMRLHEPQAVGTPCRALQEAVSAVGRPERQLDGGADATLALIAQEDAEADIAWHQALEDVVLNMGGHVPEPDDDVPLRTFWAQALGGWLEITAELNGLNHHLNAIRAAAQNINWTSPSHSRKALEKALERYDQYVAHEMQSPPVYAADALTLSAAQQGLLTALADKRNSILRNQREHSAQSGGRLPDREEVTVGELLTELLEQKAAQAGIEMEVST